MGDTMQIATEDDIPEPDTQMLLEPQVRPPPDAPYVPIPRNDVTALAIILADSYSNFPFGSLAVILVGPDEYRLDVHKDIFCEASAFFKAAFEGNFLESGGVVRLPEQEVTTFKFFVRWVYTRRLRGFLYPKTRSPSLSQIERDIEAEAEKRGLDGPDGLPWDDPLRKQRDIANYQDIPLLLLVKLYILADVLQAPGLQDHVISVIDDVYYPPGCASAFWHQGDDRVAGLENPVESFNLAWTMTPDESNLRRVMLEMVLGMFTDIFKPPFDDTLDSEFIKQVFRGLVRRHKDSARDLDDMVDRRGTYDVCDYHKHDAGCPENTNFPVYR